MVKFLNSRELRNTPSTVWKALDSGDAVAIVANGAPRALMVPIDGGDVEGALQLVHRLGAQQALARIQAASVEQGTDTLGDAEIGAEVAAARAERTSRR